MNNADLLIETALMKFAERGYAAVGVQEIVDAVGLSKPTLYHYFHDKQGLLQAVIQRKTTGFLQDFISASQYEHNLTFSLQKLLRSILSFGHADPVFFRYFTSLRYAPIDSVERVCADPVFELLVQQLQDLFIASVTEHGNLRGKEELQAAAFWAYSVELARLAIDGKLLLDDGMIYRSLHQFEHGIYS